MYIIPQTNYGEQARGDWERSLLISISCEISDFQLNSVFFSLTKYQNQRFSVLNCSAFSYFQLFSVIFSFFQFGEIWENPAEIMGKTFSVIFSYFQFYSVLFSCIQLLFSYFQLFSTAFQLFSVAFSTIFSYFQLFSVMSKKGPLPIPPRLFPIVVPWRCQRLYGLIAINFGTIWLCQTSEIQHLN